MIVFSFLFFKQKTAYEMRISDWSSDVCSSDLAVAQRFQAGGKTGAIITATGCTIIIDIAWLDTGSAKGIVLQVERLRAVGFGRSEEHTSELQSLMRISYAVFCLKKKKEKTKTTRKTDYNKTINRT